MSFEEQSKGSCIRGVVRPVRERDAPLRTITRVSRS